MRNPGRNGIVSVLAGLVLAAAAGLAAAQDKQPAAEEAFKQLEQFKPGDSQRPLRTIEMLAARATGDPARRREVADRLAGLLAGGKVSHDAKVFICRVLPVVASEAHVPPLAKMLGEAKTADMARRALAAIEGEASGKALRGALGTLEGPALVGLVNSLGERADAKAVGALAKLLVGSDADVAEAAARALGKIGTADAAAALRKATAPPKGLEALLDARLRCAERLASSGDAATAASIYRQVLASKGPVRWRVAGLSGYARTAGAEATAAVLEAMGSDAPALRATALRLARHLKGTKATEALVKQLDTLEPPSLAVLIDVLGERGDRGAARAVAKRLAAKDDAVRVAAIGAMAQLGDASTVGPLARLAAAERGAVQRAARASLTRLTGPGVDGEFLAAAAKGAPAVRIEVMAALAARRAADAEKVLIEITAEKAEPLRGSALAALAVVGGAAAYPKLIDLIVAPPSPATAQAAEKAVRAIGGRLGNLAARVGPLLAALKKAPASAKPPLLRLLGNSGGAEALDAVRGAVGDGEGGVADAAVRALASWPDAAAAGELLKISRESRSNVHRTLALRGYLRLARAETDAAERLKMLQAVKKISKTPAAKRLLLSGLAAAADPAAMELALSFLDDEPVRAEAAQAVLTLGKALLRTDRQVVRAAMTKLQAKTADAGLLEQARALHAESLKPPRRAVGASQVGLQPDKKRSDAAKKALSKRAPKGYRLVCYLDCGPDEADGKKPAPALRVLEATRYSWAGADQAGTVRQATVHFAGEAVDFEATGLNPKKTYQLGFTWWDFDHDTREQSVWISGGKPARTVKLLGATKLPSFQVGGKKAAEHTLPIPRNVSVFGTVRITFRNEASPNVVVSEIWLWESEAESAAAKPLRAGAAARGPVGKRAAKKPPSTQPVPVKPGKKALKRVLIVTGIDYPGHPWRKTAPVLAAGLDKDPRLAIDVVETPDFLRSEKLGDYDAVVVHFMNWQKPDPGPVARENLKKFVAGGKGMVLVHFACGAFQGWPEFAKLAGRAWNPKFRAHDAHGRFRVKIVDADHPVTKGMKPFDTVDELYTCLDGKAKIRVLASSTSKVDKKDYAMAFVLTYGKGRVFHSPLGHDVRAFPPDVLALFRRGTAWVAGLPPTPPAGMPDRK